MSQQLFDTKRFIPNQSSKNDIAVKKRKLDELNARKEESSSDSDAESCFSSSTSIDNDESNIKQHLTEDRLDKAEVHSADSSAAPKPDLRKVLAEQLDLPQNNHKISKIKHISNLQATSTKIQPSSLESNKNESINPPIRSFKSILNSHLYKKLKKNNVTNFFPCQNIMLNNLLMSQFSNELELNFNHYLQEERLAPKIPCPDLLIRAPTGSGKTLAFVLPVLEIISRVPAESRKRQVYCLAVLPTKNLAKQVFEVFNDYSEGLDIKCCLLKGDASKNELCYFVLGGVKVISYFIL